jgi:hypothetical protein
MYRDKLKDLAYFEKYLKYQNTRIEKFLSLAKQTEISKGLSDSGVQKAYGFVVKFLLDNLYASYSCGKPPKELCQIYEILADASMKVNFLSYSQLIDIASFAVLLKPEHAIKEKIVNIINKKPQDDILLEGFGNFLEGKGFVYTSKNFKFKDIYKEISGVLAQSNKNKQLELLADYIKNNWYDSNKESAWYDSHNSKEDIYVGYWCFEGLALSVALGLNSKKLIGMDYIPDGLIVT